jgi:acetyl-CoA carboxylase carboxyltransferase component
VPKITVIIRKAYGAGYYVMNGSGYEPDQIYAWEAIRKEIDVYIAAGNAMIDDVIDPRETRPRVIGALRMAADKKVERPWRKHGVMPV